MRMHSVVAREWRALFRINAERKTASESWWWFGALLFSVIFSDLRRSERLVKEKIGKIVKNLAFSQALTLTNQ